MTLREIWSQKTDWMPNQKGFHDAGHAGIIWKLASIVWAILFACGVKWELGLMIATGLAMLGGVLWEIVPKAYAKFRGRKGEDPWSMACDVAQFWAFTPISLTLFGNWPLGIFWAVVLWLWYVVSLKAMYK